MSETSRPLQELNRLAAKARVFVDLDTEFALPDGRRLVVRGEITTTSLDGTKGCILNLAILDGRVPESVPDPIEHRTPSAAFRSLARQFPEARFPPVLLRTRCSGAPLSTPAVKKLLLAGLAEAFGHEPKVPASVRKPVNIDPTVWVTVLKSGKSGVSRWNRCRAADRRAVDLSGADLSSADLTGVNLRGVRLKGTSFAGATLRDALLGGARLDQANLARCDLRAADLKEVEAAGALFQDALLAQIDMRRGGFDGASFARADLTDADLSGAILRKTDFDGARLDSVKLDGATFDSLTSWPAGFTIPAEAIFAGRGTDPRLSGKGKNAVAADINGLMTRLYTLIDPRRMKRTLDMLKAGKNQLFAEIEPTYIRGIVRSQTTDELVYACVLLDDGTYACCTPDLSLCMGLAGEPCKHLLVLLIGLARAGELDPATIDRWVVAAASKNHRWNKKTKNHVSDTLLRYKGVQAGEIDWRPTETIPEDFYTL